MLIWSAVGRPAECAILWSLRTPGGPALTLSSACLRLSSNEPQLRAWSPSSFRCAEYLRVVDHSPQIFTS